MRNHYKDYIVGIKAGSVVYDLNAMSIPLGSQ